MLAHVKACENQWYYNKVAFASIFFMPISFSLFIIQYVYTSKIGHLMLVKKFKGLSRKNWFHVVMKMIAKVCHSSIILGRANSFYYGECSKVGFHSSKAPWVNATNQNHHLTNKYNNKAIYVCWCWTLVHIAKYFACQQGIFYHVTKNESTWHKNI